jgi:hypothetical protein
MGRAPEIRLVDHLAMGSAEASTILHLHEVQAGTAGLRDTEIRAGAVLGAHGKYSLYPY